MPTIRNLRNTVTLINEKTKQFCQIDNYKPFSHPGWSATNRKILDLLRDGYESVLANVVKRHKL